MLWSRRGHSGKVVCVAFTLDRKCIASAGADGKIMVLCADSGHCIHLLDAATEDVVAILGGEEGPDGWGFATVHSDLSVILWNAYTGEQSRQSTLLSFISETAPRVGGP
jgi:WD40 repeat protein